MPVTVELVPGDKGWPEVKPLEDLVYTPEVMRAWIGRGVTWAHADMRALVRGEGGRLLAHAGAFVRLGEWDGLPVKLGGIGGVLTHPDHRRQGHARTALKRALTWLHDEAEVAFAVLFCEPHNMTYYHNQGWQTFDGTVLARQPSGTAPFTLFHALTLSIRRRAATRGTLDLKGEPW